MAYQKIDLTKDLKTLLEKGEELEPTLSLLSKNRAKIQYIVQDWVKKMGKEHQNLLKEEEDSKLHNGPTAQADSDDDESLLNHINYFENITGKTSNSTKNYESGSSPEILAELI
jgi:hypothetical protein